jgi:hypothetical protein
MSAQPVTSPAWTPAAERLHKAMQRGAVLQWGPRIGFVLVLPSGRTCKPPLYAVWTLRRAGLIYTDDPAYTQPRVWHIAGRRGSAP